MLFWWKKRLTGKINGAFLFKVLMQSNKLVCLIVNISYFLLRGRKRARGYIRNNSQFLIQKFSATKLTKF